MGLLTTAIAIALIAKAAKNLGLGQLVHDIIYGIINFFKHVIGWFKSLKLDKNKDIPFVANPETFKALLKKAPVKNVGIFEGVYDLEKDEISRSKWIEADDVDEDTSKVVGKEEIVILE